MPFIGNSYNYSNLFSKYTPGACDAIMEVL